MDAQVSAVERHKAYWTSSLANMSTIKLPTQPQKTQVSSEKNDKAFFFDQSFSQKMYEFSRQYNGNLFSFLYLGLIETLSAITQQEDLTIGTFACDTNNDACKLAIRHQLNPKLSFKEQYGQATLNMFKAYEHRDASFETFLKSLKIPNTNVFKIMLNLIDENGHNMLHLPCREVKCMSFPCHDSKAELSFSLQHTENGINGMLRYNSDQYSKEFIETFLSNFESTLHKNLENF